MPQLGSTPRRTVGAVLLTVCLAVPLAFVAPGPARAAGCAANVVAASSFTFQPGSVAVAPGGKVCWTNPSSGFHNVHFEDGQFDTPTSPSSSWPVVERTFEAPGTYRYYCEQHGGVGGQGMSGVVTVGEPANLAVTAVTPKKLGQGAAAVALSVVGTGFKAGAAVSVAGTGVTVTSTQFVSATKLVAKTNVASTAATGFRTVTVTQTGGTASCSQCLTITAAPKPTAVSPASSARGKSVAVTITGTGFVTKAKVLAGAGITVSNVVVVNATKITATFAVQAGAAKGKRSVTVTNADKGKGTLANAFTIT